MNKRIFIPAILFIICLGVFFRFYHLNRIPPGLSTDEASIGYDAYSILLTGRDRYGEFFPVFFRSFGDYQSPLYTYLTVIPIYLFGLSIFSTHLVSALSGSFLLIITIFLILQFQNKFKLNYVLITTIVLSLAPWAVFFSRQAVEANLALSIFAASILFYVLSFREKKFYILASSLLALSTYAYHAQRVIGVLFIFSFLLLFRSSFTKDKKIVIIGILLFILVQIPQLLLINSEASQRRISQVNYWTERTAEQNTTTPFFIRKFFSQYSAYFSPRSLFFDPDPQPVRSMPDLSTFYSWMVIPFLFGIKFLLENKSTLLGKILILLMLITPIPAALTVEPFYTLRVLPLLWVFTIVISIGIYNLFLIIRSVPVNLLLWIGIFLYSIGSLYISNFILLKYEKADNYGYSYMKLVEKIVEMEDRKFVVDTHQSQLAYIWFIFFKKSDPEQLQRNVDSRIVDNYYNSVIASEYAIIDNIEIRPIFWRNDICKDQILVGNALAISESQIKEHKLNKEFEIKDLSGKIKLVGFSTSPKEKCFLKD